MSSGTPVRVLLSSPLDALAKGAKLDMNWDSAEASAMV